MTAGPTNATGAAGDDGRSFIDQPPFEPGPAPGTPENPHIGTDEPGGLDPFVRPEAGDPFPGLKIGPDGRPIFGDEPSRKGGFTFEQLRWLFPAWPDALIQIYMDEWIASGDNALALARVRASPEFEQAFPGIKRPNGELRMTEGEYLTYRDNFNATLISIGLNPAYFTGTFLDLLTGDVSMREAISRIESAYTQVLSQSPELLARYAALSGLTDLTEAAIVASFLDPRIGEEILNGRISVAEIAAASDIRGVSIDLELAQRLVEVGISTGVAAEAFGAAAEAVPIINVLARRHNDPDDDFDIDEFVAAQLLDDPFERRRMRRLLNQERASFSPTIGFIARQPSLGVSGLSQL